MKIGEKTFTGEVDDSNWAARAECANVRPDYLFETGMEQNRVVRDVCRRVDDECPVQAPCLVAALKAGDENGVWGGLTERERRSMGGRKLLQIITAEEEAKKAQQVHRNTYPELYARITSSSKSVLGLVLPGIEEQAS